MIRPAHMSDAEAICGLVNYWAERGRMLHKSLEGVYESLRDFVVCHRNGQVVGCAALSIYWKDLGELRSLAVAAEHAGRGVGQELVLRALEQAKTLGLARIFALTYEPNFFAKLGFRPVDKAALPSKVWRDCIRCPRADACDEVAMLLELS